MLVLVSFVVGYFVGDSAAINRVNKQIDLKVSSNQNNVSNAENANKNNDNQSTGTSSQKDSIIKIGEEGASGNWSIKVLEVKEVTTIEAGNASDNKTTKDKYIVIKLEMKNLAKSPIEYSPLEFLLGDSKTKNQYEVNTDAMGAANGKETIYKKNGNFVGMYTKVNPGMSKQTYIIFEVPKDVSISEGVLLNTNAGANPVGYYLK